MTYADHISVIREDMLVDLPDYVTAEARPGSTVLGEILTEWLDGTQTKQQAKVDLISGEIIERYNAENEVEKNTGDTSLDKILENSESSEIFIKHEIFKYENIEERVKIDYRGGEKTLNIKTDDIIHEVNKKNLAEKHMEYKKEREQENNKRPKP